MRTRLSGTYQLGIIKPCKRGDIDPKRPKSQQKLCLYTRKKPTRLLGRHPNRASALRQERVIEMRKHGR
jgi:hypothetical protein